jgi:hypothetical protein
LTHFGATEREYALNVLELPPHVIALHFDHRAETNG